MVGLLPLSLAALTRAVCQSTYCSQVHAHCGSVGRSVHVVNLDPAAERFDYAVSGDVRDLITLEACF